MTPLLIAFASGITAFAFGWVMRGREIPSLIREAKELSFKAGYKQGLDTPLGRPLTKPQAP